MIDSVAVDVAARSGPDQNVVLVAKGGSIIFGGKLFTYASRLVITFLLARSLGATQYGLYNLALTALTVASVLGTFGLDAALVRFVAIYNGRRDQPGIWSTIQVAFGISMLLSLVLGGLMFVYSDAIAIRWFKEPTLAPLLRVASPVVPFLTFNSMLACTTEGFKRMQYSTLSRDIVQPLLRVIFVVILLIAGIQAIGAVLTYGIAVALSSIMLLYFLHKRLFSLWRRPRLTGHKIRELLVFSFPVHLSDLMTTFNENIQTLLLGALYTVTSVGVYGIARQINLLGHMFHIAIMTTSRPIVAELFDRDDRDQLRRLYQMTTKWTFTVNLPLFLILCVFPAQILSVFGKSFAHGATALVLLACANMVDVTTGMCGAMLDMTGHTRMKLINNTVRLILALGVSVLLIPRWGPIGAAAAALVVVSITNLLRIVQVYFLFGLQPYNRSFAKPIAAGGVALSIAVFAGSLYGGPPTFPLVVGESILLLVVYVGMIMGLGLSAEDRQILGHFRKRMGTRLMRRRTR